MSKTAQNQSSKGFFGLLCPQKGDSRTVKTRKIGLLISIIGIILCIIIFCIALLTKTPSKQVGVDAETTQSEIPVPARHSVIGENEPGLNELASQMAESEAASLAALESDVAAMLASLEQQNQASSANGNTSSKAPAVPAAPKEMPAGYLPKFQNWYNANTDVKAHLVIPGTNVNYPVMQTSNNTYYLNHNEYKAKYGWGIPYLDYRVSISSGGNTQNIVMYGHGDDKRGLMLSNMKKYRDVNFYKAHPVIQFDTVYSEGQWKVITMFKEDTNPNRGNAVFAFWNYLDFGSEADFNNYITNVKSRAFFTSSVDVLPTDQLLSIQVCEDTNINNYNRLVLVCRKVREGESASVDTSTATQLKTK